MRANIAFVFPGQGSQSVGMLAELGAEHPIVIETFAQASEVLGYDLWDLVQHDKDGDLNQTHITQPALLTASVALWRLWLNQGGIAPSVLAGHSLGEYSALVCAGALDFSDAVRLVEARGQFMQAAVPPGEGARLRSLVWMMMPLPLPVMLALKGKLLPRLIITPQGRWLLRVLGQR